MLMELVFCLFVSTILLLVLFLLHVDYTEGDHITKSHGLWSRLQQLWDKGIFKNKPLEVSKDVIFAMTQRGIYSLNSNVKTDDDEVRQWTREMLERSCFKLEQSYPNINSYMTAMNDFLEKVEKDVEKHKDNLCELVNELKLISETHQFVVEEINKKSCQENQGNIKAAVIDDCNLSWIPPVPSFRCPIIAGRQVDNDFVATLDQFEEENGLL